MPELNIPDDNAAHDADVSTTTAWSGDTGSLTSDGSSITLSGSSVSVAQAATDITSGDWIMYLKVQLESGYSTWTPNAAGNGQIQFSLGYNWGAGTTADGYISLGGMVSGNFQSLDVPYDYKTAPIEVAIQYDSRVDTLNLFIKESDLWTYKGSVNADSPYPSDSLLRQYHGSGGGTAATTYYWLMCKPNLAAIGDSITAGHNFYDPDPDYYAGTDDYQSTWMAHTQIKNSGLRNTLIVNYGAGSETSSQIDARVNSMLTNTEARAVFLQASANDYDAGLTQAQRTTNIQASIDKITTSGADAVLLNAVYPDGANGDYYRAWWETELVNVTGAWAKVDIMDDAGMTSGGYLNPDYTLSDGVHPNVQGYTIIGEYVESKVNLVPTVAGEVRDENGNLAERTIRVYRRDDGSIVEEVQSSGGSFQVTVPTVDATYDIRALAAGGSSLPDLVHSGVAPVQV